MPAIKEDKAREERIQEEIIVDAYGPEEQAMGWFYYLQDNICFPFQARCVLSKATSPLKIGETVEVIEMASEDVCPHDMLVQIRWQGRTLAVPVSQLEAIKPDAATKEALRDWNYWLRRGYEL
jgi:hypothetical protein